MPEARLASSASSGSLDASNFDNERLSSLGRELLRVGRLDPEGSPDERAREPEELSAIDHHGRS
jgi:hypothetical protein